MSRRELLAASALLLVPPGAALARAQQARTAVAATTTTAAEAGAAPIILCWNENPYGPSPAARAAITAAVSQGCRYPDDEIGKLVDLLAKKEGVAQDRIVTGTGSGELLRALGMLCGHGGGEIVAAQPTYQELTEYAQGSGAELKWVPVDGKLRHDLTAMHAAVSDRTRAVYICNPNNPTGTVVPASAIEAFVSSMPEHVTTIVDEAYLDFTDAPEVRSVASLTSGSKRVVVLRTFSKIHGMAGVRCGYAIARPDVAKEIAKARMTTPNVFAVRGACASLGDHAFLADTRRRILASRKRITSGLSSMGFNYAEPQGNFVFFDTGAPLPRITEFMRKRNILVGRRFPPLDNWCRITIGTEPEVDAFLEGLRAFRASGQSKAA
ncbi:MAG TPA: histidinol-phosphate transaminase [Steroidobacteraceae bacterium]|nr:histidinol-phosphate transaminase [Steroidobacteraceae bacterium]